MITAPPLADGLPRLLLPQPHDLPGELDNEDIQVTITDEATGEAPVDEATTTFDSGFIGFWLPDDTTGLIEVSYQGRTGTTEFSTTDDGATCVTDLRLT